MQNSSHDLILYCQTKLQVTFFTSFSEHNNGILLKWTIFPAIIDIWRALMLYKFAPVSHNLLLYPITLVEMITLSFLHPIALSLKQPEKCLF